MIDYQLLDYSAKFYENHGFRRIESPWTVSKAIDDITRPSDRIPFQLKHNDKCLVGSGEQSFLYLYLKGYLPKGKYQTITPCFRYEAFDETHTKYFMKNELMQTDKVESTDLENIVDIAYSFFISISGKSLANVKQTKDGFDIEINGKEVGSYGIRECEFLKWIYGTGCAEPRTSSVINGLSQKRNT